MSLSKVSTELDETILGHLTGHSATLAAVCRTSKYYRSLAEPILYETIDIVDDIEFRLSCLLTRFVDSPHLAKHVKRFTLGYISGFIISRDDPPVERGIFNDDMVGLEGYGQKIHEAIKKIDFSSAHDEMGLAGRVRATLERIGFARGQAGRPAEVAMVFILGMTENIEHIRLHTSERRPMVMTARVLGPQRSLGIRPQSCQKLKSIEIHGKYDSIYVRHFLYTWAQRALFHECNIDFSPLQIDHTNVSPLCDLVLKNSFVSPTTLEHLLSDTALGKLTSVEIDNVTDLDGNWASYNLTRLSGLLMRYLADLKYFTFVNSRLSKYDRIVSFGSFKELRCLCTLQVDLVLLVDLSNTSRLYDCQASLPPSLERLWLTDCKSHDIELVRQRKDGQQICLDTGVSEPDACQAIWNLLTGSFSAPALRILVVNVVQQPAGMAGCGCEHTQVGGETLNQLGIAVDSAATRGLSLQILEQIVPFDRLREIPGNARSLLW